MAECISREILDDEILVRYIFFGHFKRKKTPEIENLELQNIFVDTRFNTVSLLRNRYNNENDCVRRGFEAKKDLAGFFIFKKSDFINSLVEHIEANDNPNFKADIVSSPLDENFEVIPEEIDVFTDTPINPGHADLVYIDPGNALDEEANTALRRYSRVLSKYCKKILLSEVEFNTDLIFPVNFSKIFEE